MKRTRLLCFLSILATLMMAMTALSPLSAAGARFRPGLWEVTSTAEGPHPHSATKRRCYTPDEVKVANGSEAEVRAATQANAATRSFQAKGCKIQELRIAGDQITEVVQCPSFVWQDVTTYLPGDRFETETTMTPKKGDVRKIRQQAHRVGECGAK